MILASAGLAGARNRRPHRNINDSVQLYRDCMSALVLTSFIFRSHPVHGDVLYRVIFGHDLSCVVCGGAKRFVPYILRRVVCECASIYVIHVCTSMTSILIVDRNVAMLTMI